MKVKKLEKDEVRVIAIDQNAIFELLTESMMGNAELYFDLLDSKKVNFQMKWCLETNTFICAVLDKDDRRKLDLNGLAKTVGITTKTLYEKNRYCVVRVETSCDKDA